MDLVILERDGKAIVTNPTTEAVFDAMSAAFKENGLEGPPELALQFYPFGDPETSSNCSLQMMLAFHPTLSTTWIVYYSAPKIRGSARLLAVSDASSEQFERRTCCGTVSEYRRECLISDHVVLRAAIEYFIDQHSMCEALEWIPYDVAVRDVDNSVQLGAAFKTAQ
ncbi:MAG: hypothetical protein ACRC1K_13505 [Planctomycetia bacterium]